MRSSYFVLMAVVLGSSAAHALDMQELPGVVDVDEHLGAAIPREIVLRDESGKTITMGDLLVDNRPTILMLGYYHCPMLCPLVLNGITNGLHEAGFVMGNDYQLLTVSIDPDDTPTDARHRKDALQAKWGSSVETGARFVVGTAEATHALADAVGFRYVYDEKSAQYAHPAVIMVLGPAGRLSRYLYGPEPSARDLRFALVEAADGKIGSIVDRVLVTCYRFDPTTRRYGPTILGFFRLGSAVILIVVTTTLALLWKIDRRRHSQRNSI